MTTIHVFDAYGTLFDVHSAVARHAEAIGPAGGQVSAIWRAKQLEYSWVRTLSDRYLDFETLTEQALDFALAAVPLANRECRADLLAAYQTLDCYSEVPEALKRRRASGVKTAILSNGSPAMLAAAVESAGLGDLLDASISVDPIRQFKTVPATYTLITDHFDCAPGDVTFHSSNRWDIAGATAFGFQTVWVNRTGQPDEYADLPPGRVVADISV
ncbi:haloacid dehalogenase type II [Rhizobiaceae bacterium]|nr:haloacid dehalogenase type II [Rhizobiaceae bacterium]